jgi:hypothetical protein
LFFFSFLRLFHGTGSASALDVALDGVDPTLSSKRCILGTGSYFARNPIYSESYGGYRPIDKDKPDGFLFSMLQCNVLVGDPYNAGIREPGSNWSKPPVKKAHGDDDDDDDNVTSSADACSAECYDSVLGGPHIPPNVWTGSEAAMKYSTVHVVYAKSHSLVQYVLEFYSKRTRC